MKTSGAFIRHSFCTIIGKKSDQIALQKSKLAMAIKSSKNYYSVGLIQRGHFVAQAIQVGISELETEQIISQITDSVESVTKKVNKILPDNFPKKMTNKIFDGLLKQSKKLIYQT